jgi:hypothetical protein
MVMTWGVKSSLADEVGRLNTPEPMSIEAPGCGGGEDPAVSEGDAEGGGARS